LSEARISLLSSQTVRQQTVVHELRRRVAEWVKMLAHAGDQLAYERDVPIADVPAELVCVYSELFQPKSPEFVEAFTDYELRRLAELYGLVIAASKVHVTSVAELQKTPGWRAVMALAKEVHVDFSADLDPR
jgi:hypothetical protein